MPKKTRIILLVGAVILVVAAAVLLRPPVTVMVDGEARPVRALTVSGAVKALGLTPGSEDRLDPPLNAWLAPGATVTLDRARPVAVFYQGIPIEFTSSERLPSALLAQAGVPLGRGDEVLLNGQRFPPDLPLPALDRYILQVRPAVDIVLKMDGEVKTLRSTAATLGLALSQAGVTLSTGDRLSQPVDTLLTGPMNVTLERARALVIQVGEAELHTYSAAETVGQALAEAGMALLGLDYAVPAEDQPLEKAKGVVRVVRVQEEVSLAQTTVPFEVEKRLDAETELDTQRVIEAGQVGLKVSRERVRYEDGREVDRQVEAEWTASEPSSQVIGLGTQAVVKTLDTPDGPVEYYRAVTVYATSYSPCRQGVGRCSRSTSSGIPLAKGIIGVTLAWYNQFAGQRVYVPGYGVGVIGDVGGGVPGSYWIDLGYSEEDFVAWHDNVTIYFLTPVPASVPWMLP